MPILPAETDLFPDDLLEQPAGAAPWWAMYTRSRQEKQLMRRLLQLEVGFYCPTISRRYRSPAGRVRTTHLPLFPNYVFVRGDNEARYEAVSTGTISRCLEVEDADLLVADLAQIRRLIATGEPLTPEARFEPGARVRVRNGQFAGFEGIVLKRHGETRLLIDVRFMNQGASVLLDDCQVDPL
ncbi:transcription termination/antitermination protein NusG [Candidatus Laterigemmans baculatus]|uniref:transcription termination/antitermination protein NusG n=1 Tax=Candidatus Laterigemmans baculatus TaxID=2770505 RepID=UPI0013DA9154|nr:transcription termination/antitermination NusG family protein [Candidatus Laterigemmans baculatus]